MTAQKLRWGILGTARILHRLLPAFAKAETADLRAIASRSPEKAQSIAKTAGISQIYGDYQTLLDDPDIDAVYIPLPNQMHDEWTRRAADGGKHVLCEKPLTATAAQAESLVDYCRAKKVVLMDGFMWPHHPRTAALRRFLDSGAIGEVRRASGTFTFPLDFTQPNIRLQPDLAGGSLLDVGCYPVFGIRWAMGAEPARVLAVARYQNEVDIELNAILWFADGRMATLDTGFVHPQRQWLEITGEKGVVVVDKMWLPDERATFEVRTTRGIDVHAIEGHNQIVHMLDNFGRCVLENKPLPVSPDEAVKTLRVMDAIAKSALAGGSIVAVS